MAARRTAEQIQADIAAARGRLAEGVEGLVSRAHPAALRRDALGQAKAALRGVVTSAKAEFVDEAGVRWNRVGTVVLVAAGVVLVSSLLRGVGRLVRR